MPYIGCSGCIQPEQSSLFVFSGGASLLAQPLWLLLRGRRSLGDLHSTSFSMSGYRTSFTGFCFSPCHVLCACRSISQQFTSSGDLAFWYCLGRASISEYQHADIHVEQTRNLLCFDSSDTLCVLLSITLFCFLL